MEVSLIVLNFNGFRDTLKCVESIKPATSSNFKIKIIVVDNASTDGSLSALKKLDGIHLISNRENLGYSGGNNIGIKFALKSKSDYICVLNNDTIIDKNLITNLLKSPQNAIVSPKIYFYPGSEFHKDRYQKIDLGKVIWFAGGFIDWNNVIGKHRGVDEVDHGQFEKEEEIDYATGACIFAKREVFEKVGFFDEKYFLYLEDMDFSLRAKKLSFRIIYQPKAVMWHKNAASAGGSGSKLQDYYITRNRLLFSFKYAKIKTKLAVLRQVIRQASDPVKKSALIDFFMGRFGKVSKEI